MTRYILPRAPWHECILEGLHYVAKLGDVVETAPPEALASLLGDGTVLVGPHMLGARADLLPQGQRCLETENLLGNHRAGAFSNSLRHARPDLRWIHYSPWQSRLYGEEYVGHQWPTALRALPLGCPQQGSPYALFCGSLNPRRQVLLEALARAGVPVVVRSTANPAFGAELARLRAGATLVLNMRYYDEPRRPGGRRGLFEADRALPALGAGVPVLSELSCDDLPEHPLLRECAYEEYPAAAAALWKELTK